MITFSHTYECLFSDMMKNLPDINIMIRGNVIQCRVTMKSTYSIHILTLACPIFGKVHTLYSYIIAIFHANQNVSNRVTFCQSIQTYICISMFTYTHIHMYQEYIFL